MGAVLDGLRSLDAYPKPDEEQSVKTVTGAVGRKSKIKLQISIQYVLSFSLYKQMYFIYSFRVQPLDHAAALLVQPQ
jgi:hypothetical protein